LTAQNGVAIGNNTPLTGPELADTVRTLSIPQQAALARFAESPAMDIPTLARVTGLGASTIRHWRYDPNIPFKLCFEAIRTMGIDELPDQARYQAKAAAQTAATRDIEIAIKPNDPEASPAMMTAIGRRRDSVYKLAGLLSDAATDQVSIVAVINSTIVAAPREPRPWEVVDTSSSERP